MKSLVYICFRYIARVTTHPDQLVFNYRAFVRVNKSKHSIIRVYNIYILFTNSINSLIVCVNYIRDWTFFISLFKRLIRYKYLAFTVCVCVCEFQ